MYGAGVVAHRAQLFRLAVGRVGRIVDGVCGPDADEAISSSCDEPLSIGRDMAAVDFKVLLLPAMREPYWTDVFHGGSKGALGPGACLTRRV